MCSNPSLPLRRLLDLAGQAKGRRSIGVVAVAAGLASYFRLGRSEDPSFIMVVQAAWLGADEGLIL